MLATILNELKELSDGIVKWDDEQSYQTLYRLKYDKLRVLVMFSINLLRESSSRSIYNSVDVSLNLNII